MKKIVVRQTLVLFLCWICSLGVFAQIATDFPIADLRVIKKAYPEVSITSEYDESKNDWKVTIVNEETTTILYWAEGRLLPADKLAEKTNYRFLLYRYPQTLANPADFTNAERTRLRSIGSTQNRRTASITPPFFYDAVFKSGSRQQVEQHLIRIDFLGKQLRIHSLLSDKLQRIQQAIQKLALTNSEVNIFASTLETVDGYQWREIRDTSGKSFHSFGIAIDILPQNWRSKIIYWNWQKQIDPENWMLVPLHKRWMPPTAVIELFEKEGFIWGGKWAVWDNMHFEYHPELLEYQKKKQ